MWTSIHDAIGRLANLAIIYKVVFLMYGVWQFAQIIDRLDPLKGKYFPVPQFGAVIATLGALGWASGNYGDRRKYSKRKLVWHLSWFLISTMVLFFLSFNLHYGWPERWFIGWADARWLGTMLAYWGFGAGLGASLAIINEIARTSGRSPPALPREGTER